MLAGSALLAAVPVLISSLIISYLAYEGSHNALGAASQKQLTAIRDTTQAHIEDKFSQYRNQVMTLSNSRMIIDAMTAFKSSFQSYSAQTNADSQQQLQKLAEYYNSDYYDEFRRRNPNTTIDVTPLYQDHSATTSALQYQFIKANPNPLGEKHLLTDLDDSSSYAQYHSLYHPILRQYLEQFSYYDIFLVDSQTGHVVYSVFKELDFATSLKTGPYTDAGIGKAFAKANTSDQKNFSFLTDFAPYRPSYDDPAAFIASPIIDNNQKIGILIFQMPIDEINTIMTHDGRWQEKGLSATGETYLVGNDLTMRSMSRFLIEDKTTYLQALQSSGATSSLIDTIASKSTTIGLQQVQSKSVAAALAGDTGFDKITDYRGERVLSAYAPLNIQDVNWAIISEIDEQDAYQAASTLAEKIYSVAISAIVIISAISIGIGIVFANGMIRPILELSNTLAVVERDTDLTQRTHNNSDDETGTASKALNSMLDNFSGLIRTLIDAVTRVAQSSKESLAAAEKTNQSVLVSKDETQMVATAVTEMTATTQEIAGNTAEVAKDTNQALEATQQCQSMMEQSINSLEALSQQVDESAQVIQQLENDSESVSQVLDVIRNVADQTNLLALNAAIEAARAGEQGRGFAVVADEVRTLAKRTQESTTQIQSLIESFQTGAAKAVVAMQQSREKSSGTVEISISTGQSLNNILQLINRISDVMLTIASAAEEQTNVSEEIQQNVTRISDHLDSTAAAMAQTTQNSQDLEEVASGLEGLTKKFKV